MNRTSSNLKPMEAIEHDVSIAILTPLYMTDISMNWFHKKMKDILWDHDRWVSMIRESITVAEEVLGET